jgi:hypothetical protein
VTTTLSFRKESIQQASSASEALNRQAAERTDASSPKHALERRPITLTTTIFAV